MSRLFNDLLRIPRIRDLRRIHYLNSCTGFLLLFESILNCPFLHIVLFLHNNHSIWLVSCISQMSRGSSDHPFHNTLFLIVPETKLNLGKRAFSVAAPRVWNELPITLKTSETIATFRKKTQDIFIPNCISTINLGWSLVLIMTFERPCLRLCLMILFVAPLSSGS